MSVKRDYPRFQSAQEIRRRTEEYFRDRQGTELRSEAGDVVLDKQGRPVMLGASPPTVTGLALALGFTRRQALLDYPDDAPFAREICRARMRAEDYLEGQMMDKEKFQGARFDLICSFGWPAGDKAEPPAAGEESGGGVVMLPPLKGQG